MHSTDKPINQLSAVELAAAVERSLFDLFRAMAHIPGAELEEMPHLSRHLASPFNPMFKGVWQTDLAPSEVDDAIDESLAWFQERAAPFAFWWTGMLTRPTDMDERLKARGLIEHEYKAPGMVAELRNLDYNMLRRVPAGFHIERVTNEAQLQDFKRTFVTAYEVPEWAGQAWVDATHGFGIGQAPWEQYVGYLDGEPVACNMLFNGAGVATVFGVGTVKQARGKGIGAAITLIAYQDALEMGYRYGVLFASELGTSVYHRIGFQVTDVRISRYLWLNRAEELPRIGRKD